MAGSAASVLVFFSALAPGELRRDRDYRDRILAFERTNHRLMMAVASEAAGRPLPAGIPTAGEAWKTFNAALSTMCPDLAEAQPDHRRLRDLCRPGDAERAAIGSALQAVSLPDRPLDASVLRALLAQREEVMALREQALDRSFALEKRADEDYAWAIASVETSTAGFAVSALILLLLTGRASQRHLISARRAIEASEETERAHRLLQETIESIPAGIVVYDRDERLLMFNARGKELNPVLALPGSRGKTYEELLNDTVRLDTTKGRLTQTAIPQWLERFRAQAATVHQVADGRWFELSTVSTPSGNHVRVRVDISAGMEQHKQIERERERYQTLVESLGDTVFALDRDGRYLFASATVLTLLGVPADQIVGRNHYDFIHPDDLAQGRADAVALFRSKSTEMRQRVLRLRTIDGEVRHVEVRYRRPTRSDTDGAAVVGLMRDVTIAVRMARRLDRERMRLRSVVESSGATILLTDRDLRIQVANQEFWRLLGLPPDRGTGEPLGKYMQTQLEPELYRRWATMPLSPDEQKPVRYTSIQPVGQGAPRVFLVTATPVVGEDHRVRQIVFLAVDDTDRQAAEQALFAADRLATLGEMAATVVHDLRQPLQVMALACASAIEEVEDQTFVLSKLGRIDKQIARANAIVEDLRLFARGDVASAAETFGAEQAILAAVNLVKGAHPRSGFRVSRVVEATPRLVGHRARLEQVLVNLLRNAIESGARSIEVTARPQRSAERDVVCLTVTDNGPGIAAELLPRLFDSFVTTKPRNQGTGLGLRICRRLIEEMGGTVAGANRPGGGAEFTILLPAEATAAGPQAS